MCAPFHQTPVEKQQQQQQQQEQQAAFSRILPLFAVEFTLAKLDSNVMKVNYLKNIV